MSSLLLDNIFRSLRNTIDEDDFSSLRAGLRNAVRYPGFDINAPIPGNPMGMNLLHYAVANVGTGQIQKYLINDMKMDPNARNATGGTLMHSFATGSIGNRSSASATFEWLESLGLNCIEKDDLGRTPIALASNHTQPGNAVRARYESSLDFIEILKEENFPMHALLERDGKPGVSLIRLAEVGLLPTLAKPEYWEGRIDDLHKVIAALPVKYHNEVDVTHWRTALLDKAPNEEPSAVKRYVRPKKDSSADKKTGRS